MMVMAAGLLSVDASVPKTEFTGSKLRPPVYLTGAYYTEPDGLFDEYLYVTPTVYIDALSEHKPIEGSYVYMYGQFLGTDRALLEEGPDNANAESAKDPNNTNLSSGSNWYEGWSCSMKFYNSLEGVTTDDIIQTLFYEGYGKIASQIGTYNSVNGEDIVETSVWSNDPDRSIIKLSGESAKGNRYYMNTCTMKRKMRDEFSTIQMKFGDTIQWQYGFKLYSSKGDYQVNYGDAVRSEMSLYDGASRSLATLGALVLTALSSFY